MNWTTKGEKKITLHGTADEIEAVDRMLKGAAWVCNREGKLQVHAAFDEPPPPTSDPATSDQWPTDERIAKLGCVRRRKSGMQRFSIDYRSIYVHHICGYSGAGVYADRADALERVGFSCLRSRRGSDGKFWEVWYLPGASFAEGALKGASSEKILEWVPRHISPGVIEFAGERWCLELAD